MINVLNLPPGNLLPIPIILQLLAVLLGATIVNAQATSSSVDIITTYSHNGQYYLRSIPFDKEFPTLRGRTYVFKTGQAVPSYSFDRGFDSVTVHSNNLFLSDDGEVILFVLSWGADEEREGLKSINIYKHGEIFKSFTETEITGCDMRRERCSLVYFNFDEVVDKARSKWGTKDFKKVYKAGVSDDERFLSDFSTFSFGNTVYLTDSKKKVHSFDLKEGNYLGSKPFDAIFEELKGKGRLNRTEAQHYQAPTFLKFPRLRKRRYDPLSYGAWQVDQE